MVPVPDNNTTCKAPSALSLMVRVPVTRPTTVGWNLTLAVHFAPTASVDPQVFVEIAKFGLTVTPPMVSVIPLVLVNVAVLAMLLVPTVRLPKLNNVGETVAAEDEVISCDSTP